MSMMMMQRGGKQKKLCLAATALLFFFLFFVRPARGAVVCAIPKGQSQCNPHDYPVIDPVLGLSAACYCTDSKSVWGGGSYCGSQCVSGACGSSVCECTCYSDNGGLPYCASDFYSYTKQCYKGVAACPTCDPGFERANCGCNNQTGDCSVGICRACPPQVSYSDGTAPCRPCSPCPGNGWYVGLYCSSAAQAVYIACIPGYTCVGCPVGPSSCRPGNYCPDGVVSIECKWELQQQCPTVAMSAPQRWCPKGSYASAGTCVVCPPATFQPADGGLPTACTACAAGTYGTASGASACAACAAGTFQGQTRGSACAACAAGQVAVQAAASACTACAPGTYWTAVDAPCTACAAGQYQSATGWTAPEGCARCSMGTYADAAGASACVRCPAAETTWPLDGGASLEDCTECAPGRWLLGVECVPCLAENYSTWPTPSFYCPGGSLRAYRTMPVSGATYVAVAGGPASDNVLRPCTRCVAGSSYAQPACILSADATCRPCDTPVPYLQFVARACTPSSNTVFGTCNVSQGHLDPGGVCNPCPPGTTTAVAAANNTAVVANNATTTTNYGGGCSLCPADTYKAGQGPGPCLPCPSQTLSGGGASRCTPLCPGGGFAPDGARCNTAGGGTNGVPSRVVGEWDAAHLRVVALGAMLPDGTLLAAQNMGNGGGLVWRLLGIGAAALAAGDTTTTGGSAMMDGVGVGARLGVLTALALGNSNSNGNNNNNNNWLLAAEGARLRTLTWDASIGALTAATVALRYYVPVGAQDPGGTVLALGLQAVSGLAALPDGGFLAADRGAHCVWRLSAPNQQQPPAAAAAVWRGSKRPVALFQPPTAGATLGSSAGSGFQLASPMALGVLAGDDSTVLDALLQTDRGPIQALGFVLDARAVWAFDAMNALYTQTNADLIYACGGGATDASAVAAGGVPCTGLAVGQLNGLAVSAGGSASGALFLSFAAPDGTSGVLAVGLRYTVSSMQARPLGRASGPGQTLNGLFFGGGGGRLFAAEGGGVGRVVEYAVGVLTPDFLAGTGSTLRCVCDAGLYCDPVRQQCVPSPMGAFAPAWSSRTYPCPMGTIGQGPEARDAATGCLPCFLPGQLTTYMSGALACQPRCAATQIFSEADANNGMCIPGCDPAQGQYERLPRLDGGGGGCARCPLGTGATGGGRAGIQASCLPCPVGQYGVPPGGLCAPCPTGTTTFFRGATLCTATTTTMMCPEDGFNGSSSFSACDPVPRRVPLPAGILRATGVVATAGGRLVVAGPRSRGATLPPWQLVEVMDEDENGVLFTAELGGTCVWQVNNNLTVAAVWAGQCGAPGSMDGAQGTGLVRLGHIQSLTLMAVEDFTPVLFVSTVLDGCAAVRAVSLYDASVSTFIGSDLVRLPVVALPQCAPAPLVLAIARGTDEVFYAVQGGTSVWRVHALQPGLADTTPDVTLPPNEGILALCARGLSGNSGAMLVLATTLGTLRVQSGYGTSPRVVLGGGNSSSSLATCLACAGRRAWWVSIDADNNGSSSIWTVGLDAAVAGHRGCVGGFVPVVSPGGQLLVCAQVGLGEYTTVQVQVVGGSGLTALETVGECRIGTYGAAAGLASHAGCVPCPLGLVAGTASVGCDPCTGAAPYALEDRCVDACPPGFFLLDKVACVACPSGSSAPPGARSQAECVACAAGTYANASTQGRCAACPAGTTSLAGSLRCVPVCPRGTCAADGLTCTPVDNDWEVVTPVFLQGSSTSMRAVGVGDGGHVFYTDGNTLMYLYDDCPAHVTASDADACQLQGTNLLAAAAPCASLLCTRGFSAFVLTAGVADRRWGTRLLYAASSATHSVYRFPILFDPASAGTLVDVGNTTLLLGGGGSSSTAAAAAAFAAYFNATHAALFPDTSGCEGWLLIGRSGAAGRGQGPFALGPLLNLPVELELSSDDRSLVISDYLNQRVCVADLVNRTLRTILGTGGACWNFGLADPAHCAGTLACGGACASLSMPLGLGLAPDDSALYLVMNQQNAVAILPAPLAASPGPSMDRFCLLDYDSAQLYTRETCSADGDSKTCMLHRPFDVLAAADGKVYVGVTNGMTVIDSATLACAQRAGYWWQFANSAGLINGGVDPATEQPVSRLNMPFRLAADAARGILYIADYSSGALRRVFIDGRCRCAEGSLYVASALACYYPTPSWHAGRLVQCPAGQFALEGDPQCHPCAEAATYGLAAAACLLAQATQQQGAQASTTGFTYARVVMAPEPIGAIAADWYGAGAPWQPSWDDIFRADSPVTYRLGRAAGRAPFGGEFLTLTFDPATGLWARDTRPLVQPRRLLPGFWHPCTSAVLIAGEADPLRCDCSQIVAAFADYNGTGGGLARWSEVREAAYLRGGRILGGAGGARLADFAGGPGTPDRSTEVYLWSRLMLFGSDAATPRVCSTGGGPCFPAVKHYQESEPPTLTEADAGYEPLSMPAAGWPPQSRLTCATGWPAHYACPNGYVWVGPNTSALADGQLLLPDAQSSQIACLSCLPGSASAVVPDAERLRVGGPYACARCDWGAFAPDVGSTACALCPSGFYANQSGATACFECPPNHYTAEGATDEGMCSPCAPGTGSCTDCVEGQYQDRAAQYECHYCGAGAFSNTTNATGCTACPMGTYQPLPGQARCHLCPPYLYTPPDVATGGATSCQQCIAPGCAVVIDGRCGQGCGLNYYFDEQTALGKAGRYGNSTTASPSGAGGCVRCPPGLLNAYVPCAMAPDACFDPPPGLYAAAVGVPGHGGDPIRPCPAGSGPNANRDGCVPCAAGLFATEGGGCRPCAEGAFAPARNSTACLTCPAGTYAPAFAPSRAVCYLDRSAAHGLCNAQGVTACTACAPGTYAPLPGGVGCALCDAGTYASMAASPACAPCAPGTFGAGNGSTACTGLCVGALGYYSGAGATACAYCAGGLVNANGSLCTGCGLGRYEAQQQGVVGAGRVCLDCPAGLVQQRTRSSGSVGDCVPCPSPTVQLASYYPPLPRAQLCLPVPPGYVANLSLGAAGGGVDAMPCPGGTFRDNTSTACAACAPGAWAPPASPACLPCPPGRYRAPGQPADVAACFLCPPGAVAPSAGATACVACPPGAQPSNEGAACAPCPANTYTADASVLPCQPCTPPTVAPPGASACGACPPGTAYLSAALAARTGLAQSGVCGACPAGYYMKAGVDDAQRATFACLACPNGLHNPLPGATSLAACVPCYNRAYVPAAPIGANRCVLCPAGKASTDGSRCVDCAPGNFSAGGVACVPCPPGTASALGGQAQCTPCPPGQLMNRTGAAGCDPCPPGTFANASGGSACTLCPLAGFSAWPGAVACAPRTTACAPGMFVAVRQGQPDTDNACVACAPCQPDEYMVSTLTDTWTRLTFSTTTGAATAPSPCPGNTTSRGYRCLSSKWPSGYYITPQALAGLSPLDGQDGLSTLQALRCTDLTFPAGTPAALAAAAQLMDYVQGPTFECYIGCRYGLNLVAAANYTRQFPDARGLESPQGNVFYPDRAKLYAQRLCLPCSTAPCRRAGRYRPQVTAAGCGPACLIQPELCVDADTGAFNDGCNSACAPPPPHAVTTGGSTTLGSDACPWTCLGPNATGPGYHLRDDGTGCEWCGATGACDATHVHVPPWLCFPYSRTQDVCRACPAMPGGVPAAWALVDAGNASAGGYCTYDCNWGFYPADEARVTLCLPCTFLNNVSCPVGTFRDVATCYETGHAPRCAPCTAPDDVQSAASGLWVTFRSAGIPVDTDNCLALCNTGYHSVLRASVTAGGPWVYLSDTQAVANVSVWNLTCVPCTFRDTIPCHGACPVNYFRSPLVPLDTSPGACKRCTTSADCATGWYAPLCMGNGTGDVGCRPCPAAPAGRQHVPYDALHSGLAAQLGLIRASPADGYACPTACIPGSVLLGDDGQTCVPCAQFIADSGCAAEEAAHIMASGGYPPGQPRACDFRFAHWNATPGPIWWDSPRFTPSFLRGLRPLAAGGPNNNYYIRQGVCWACPIGLGLPADAQDLCQLLPGFGLRDEGLLFEAPPVPVLGADLAIVLQEPLPTAPSSTSLLPPSTPGGLLDRRRRHLLTVDARRNSSSSLAVAQRRRRLLQQQQPGVLAPCPTATYNSGGANNAGVCNACPQFATTFSIGSVGLHQCVCPYGWYNLTLTAHSGCKECPADTFDRRILFGLATGGLNDTCAPCPPLETTFGQVAMSACGCRPGYLRGAGTNDSNSSSLPGRACVPCPAGSFCTPCVQGQAKCPNGNVWITPCMAGGTSPPGSRSLLNCTCVTNQSRVLVGTTTIAQLGVFPSASPPTNAGLLCMDAPPNAVPDPVTLRLGCKRGWTPQWYPGATNLQLLGCSLCPKGQFAAVDPSTTIASTTAALQCLLCPVGNYSSRTDAIGGCTPCGAGLTTLAMGATSASECTCPPGMGKDPATSKCTGCALGQYQSPDGKACVQCPDPNMVTAAGARALQDCLCRAGFLKASSTACVPCPMGTFSAAPTAAPRCTACQPGQTTAGVGAAAFAACVCNAAAGFQKGSGGLCRSTAGQAGHTTTTP